MNCKNLLTDIQILQTQAKMLRDFVDTERTHNYRFLETPEPEETKVRREEWRKRKEYTNAVHESLVVTIKKLELEHAEALSVLRTGCKKELDRLSEENIIIHHSPDTLNERLQLLTNGRMSLSPQEIQRCYRLYPKKLTEEMEQEVRNEKEITERKKEPIVMVVPKTLMINGKEIPFTMKTLKQSVWPELQKDAAQVKKILEDDLESLYIGDTISEETNTKQWGDALIAYTSACVKKTKDKPYTEQKEHVKNVFPSGDALNADMYLVMVLHYLQTGKKLSFVHYMRLYDQNKDEVPLILIFNGGTFRLERNFTFSDESTGLGSTFVFPRDTATI